MPERPDPEDDRKPQDDEPRLPSGNPDPPSPPQDEGR